METQNYFQLRIEGYDRVKELMDLATEQYTALVQAFQKISEKASEIEAQLNRQSGILEVQHDD